MRDSLRRNVQRIALVAISVTLVLMAAVLFAIVRASINADFDEDLRERARNLSALVEREGETLDFELGPTPPQSAREPSLVVLWVFDADGSVAVHTEGAPSFPSGMDGTAHGDIVSVSLDGESARAITWRFRPRLDPEFPAPAQEGEVRLVLARQTGLLTRLLWRLGLAFAGVSLALVLVAGVATRWGLARGLAPLGRLETDVEGLDEDDLSARLEMGALPSELQPTVRQVNALLGRLEAAFERERRFASDVAHELRTPLASIRAELELALRRERPAEDYRLALQRSVDEVAQLSELVDGLLLLARAEAEQLGNAREPVDAEALIREIVASHKDAADARGIDFDLQLSTRTMRADGVMLRRVLANLVSNAIHHAPPDTRVGVTFTEGCVRVENAAPQLSHSDLERLFDRFWQKSDARGSGRSGIGLCLARALAEALGLSLEATLEGPRLRMSLCEHGVDVAAPPLDPQGREPTA